jgi:hypothetical protein
MEITQIIQVVITSIPTAIGAATLIFRGLEMLAPLTDTPWDDNIVKRVLRVLRQVSEYIALNKSDKIEIKTKSN